MEAESRKGRRARPSRAKPGRTHGFTVLEDVSAITARSEDLKETLQRIVEVVAERMGTEVCSLYILDPRAQRLTLWATTGLEKSAVGKVTMSVEEGLTGMVIEKGEPVMTVDAIAHPRYKYFPETGEEKYHSFVGVPIAERGTPMGVLVVQTLRRRRFSRHEMRLLRAIAESAVELESLRGRLATRLPEFDWSIIDAHRMMLEDRSFTKKVEEAIADGLVAEAALKRVVAEYLDAFERMSAGYLRDRVVDLKDVGLRILRNLLGIEEPEHPLAKDSVLVAQELTLSDLSLVEHDHLCAIVLATGGVTSHATNLAKSFEIPTVVGVEHLTETVHEGDELIVDGNSGVVYVNPAAEVTREYERIAREYRAFNRELEGIKSLPAETPDGRRVSMYANVGLLADLMFAHRHGAEGVGLYRTEFPFITYREFPDEDEQYQLYARLVRAMEGRPVTIRTPDVGADHYPGYMRLPREENPFLGWRSIRMSLEMPDLFKVQLRAILRAGTLGRVRLLFPMISSLEEIRRAKELLEEAKEELRREGRDFDPNMPIGMMVETPSAVWLATRLIREVDFFSIGTNDLIQYLLAVDRNNRKVAQLYEPLHPAVLSAIHETVQAAKGAGKWAGMCGEMASDPLCTIVLLGLGLDDLSMGPFFIPVIKRVVRSVSYAAARAIARDVTSMGTVKEVKGYLFDGMKSLGLIELLEMYH